MQRFWCALLAVVALFVFPHSSAAATLACNSGSVGALLAGISNTTITGIGLAFPSATTTACRVQATIQPLGPSGDSLIRMELWLPLPLFLGQPSPWNGRFLGVGNGGFAGSIPTLNQGARFGYATAGTDTGHSSTSDASWGFGHPEKVTDFAYRAVHEMTVKGKAMTATFYGTAPLYSYWDGMSSGGMQGLQEAQMFPFDYDGIVAGAPPNFWTHFVAHSLHVAQASFPAPDGTSSVGYIPITKYQMISDAVVAACDAHDGVLDGVLEDPRKCGFNPALLQCPGDIDGPACLTTAQIQTAVRIYGGGTFSNGDVYFPGPKPSSEFGWAPVAGGPDPFPGGLNHFTYLVFAPGWDWHTFNADTDVPFADVQPSADINAIDPNLSAFALRGGKLIQYHGWLDYGLSPEASINYYLGVVSAMGGVANTDGFYRLFLMPGIGHVGGGPGPGIALGSNAQGDQRFQTRLNAIVQWVENGIAPDRLIATHYATTTDTTPDRTRPLCPYPQTAYYTGSGSTDDAANFVCKTAPTITWANPSAITYGTALGAAQLNATADVPGSFSYTPPLGTYLNAGPAQTLSATFTPVDTVHYANGSASVWIDVNRALLQVTADDKTKVLGGSNPVLTSTLSGFVLGDTASVVSGAADLSTSVTTASPVGTYPIVAGIGTLTAANYSFAPANGTLHVIYAPAGSTCQGQPGHAVLQPLNADGSSVFKKNATVSVKFRVCDAGGNSIGTAGVVAGLSLIQIVTGTAAQDVNEPADSTTADTAFRWDSSASQWIFNLKTTSLTANRTYTYRILLNDGSTIDFGFGLK